MTSPPPAWRVLMSAPKLEEATGMLVSPLQYGVQEPFVAACRNAIVRYLLPDAEARPDRLSPVHVSKYGANTCAGSGVPAACAVPPPRVTSPAAAVAVARPATSDRRGRNIFTSSPGR